MVELNAELVPVVKEHVKHRLERPIDNSALGTERVDLQLKEHLKLEARKRNFVWTVDEPRERGGTDTAPNPLAYFISGAAACLMNQYASLAVAMGIVLDGFEVTARAHYTLHPGGEFQDIIYDLRFATKSSKERIMELAEKAEQLCFVHNTLKGTRVKVITNVFLNGEKIR